MDERGSMAPLLAVLVVAVGGLCLGLGRLGAEAVRSAQARTAADAAALAGAADGEAAARALAKLNGGRLGGFEADGDAAEVAVELAGHRSVARAVATGRFIGSATTGGQVPELRRALQRAGELLGREVPVTSGYRSTAEQQRLWDRRHTNPYPVARPGTSMHERGRAVDVPRSFAPVLATVAAEVGLCRPWPVTDPVHFELCSRGP